MEGVTGAFFLGLFFGFVGGICFMVLKPEEKQFRRPYKKKVVPYKANTKTLNLN